MSALHALPAAAAASVKPTGGHAAVAEDSSQDVSFAAVLNAQLGVPSSSELGGLIAGAETPSAEDKPDARAQPDAAVDPTAAALPFMNLDIAAARVAAVTGDQELGQARSRSAADRGAALGRFQLLDAAKTSETQTDAAGRAPNIADAVIGNLETSEPASFAAVLQSLPPDTPPRGSRPEHGTPGAGDTLAPGAQLPVAAAASDAKADAAHRSSMLSTNVSVPVQDSRWGDAFSERVVWVSGQQAQAAEIHIEPPQLGPIEVRVSVVNDQANLLFTAPHAVARDAIQMSLPRLQDMLMNSGLTLGDVSVGAHNPGKGQDQQRPGSGTGGAEVRDLSIDAITRQSVTALRGGSGLVDLFA